MAVLIYAADGSEVLEECGGPEWSGACPKAASGALVACAGRKIVAIESGGVTLMTLRVEPDATTCPLAAFSLFKERKSGADGPPAEAPEQQGG